MKKKTDIVDEFIDEDLTVAEDPQPAPTGSKVYFQESESSRKKRGKEFPLQNVLHVLTGKMLVRDFDEIFAFMSYLTGIRKIDTVTYPLILEHCRAELVKQFPQLEHFTDPKNCEFDSEETEYWLSKQFKKHGTDIHVEKMADDDAEAVDEAVEDLTRAMTPKKRKQTAGERMSV